jgi:hypothetical protein
LDKNIAWFDVYPDTQIAWFGRFGAIRFERFEVWRRGRFGQGITIGHIQAFSNPLSLFKTIKPR